MSVMMEAICVRLMLYVEMKMATTHASARVASVVMDSPVMVSKMFDNFIIIRNIAQASLV